MCESDSDLSLNHKKIQSRLSKLAANFKIKNFAKVLNKNSDSSDSDIPNIEKFTDANQSLNSSDNIESATNIDNYNNSGDSTLIFSGTDFSVEE